MKKLIAVTLAITFLFLTFSLPAAANRTDYLVGDFFDLTDASGNKHWAYEQMSELIAMGVLKGYTQTVINKTAGRSVKVQMARPTKNITRAEFAVILYEALNYNPVQDKAPFKDVMPTWAAHAINALYMKGIIKGDPGGRFNPNRSITRAEIAVMLVLAAATGDGPVPGKTFWDVPAGYWAHDAIQKASSLGVIKGLPDGRFAPARRALRSEVMVMLYNHLRQSSTNPPQDSVLVSRATLVADGLESVVNDEEGSDINLVIPLLTGEMEEYMADGESQRIIADLKKEGLLGYRIASPGRVVSKSDYLAEVEYEASVTFQNKDVFEEVSTPIRYYLMKMGEQWYIYKENFVQPG